MHRYGIDFLMQPLAARASSLSIDFSCLFHTVVRSSRTE